MSKYLTLFFIGITALIASCRAQSNIKENNPVNTNNHDYWFQGQAEISSYKLSQARYGEIHEGQAVLVFVSEPFSESKYVKSDHNGNDISRVLKLNFTKKFNTGIYPYSMITSTFIPFDADQSLKISSSVQEWCGHAYMELLNKKKFELTVHSYFEGESIEKSELEKTYLEDDIWSLIRLNPDNLPLGTVKMIPSFFYIRLLHIPAKAYKAVINTEKTNANTSTVSINYPDLNRTIEINYENEYPHKILNWNESYYSGWGKSRQLLRTKGELMATRNSAYWTENKKADTNLRRELRLD